MTTVTKPSKSVNISRNYNYTRVNTNCIQEPCLRGAMLSNLPSGVERDREGVHINVRLRRARRRVRRRDLLQERQRRLARINVSPAQLLARNYPERILNPGEQAPTSNPRHGVDRRLIPSMWRPQQMQRNRQINPRLSAIREQINRVQSGVWRPATVTRSLVRAAPYSYTQPRTGPGGDSRLRNASELHREQQRITRARWRTDERNRILRRVRPDPSLQLRGNGQGVPRARMPRQPFTLNSTSTKPSSP